MSNLRPLFIFSVIIFITSFFYSCDDGFEDYSNSPNDRLSFSTDTVAFDTIISTVYTPIQVFKVYNRNSKALLISSITLEQGKESNFRINVNGKSGDSFTNIEIKDNDSISVFVDARPKATGINTPEYIKDYVVFNTNGNRDKIVIEASAQDAYMWKGVIINKDSTLNNEKPYLIYDSLVIEKDVNLNIPPGTIFYMHGNSVITVKGTIKAKGTLEKPIVFRGDRFDQVVNIPYDLVPGQWEGMFFEADSYDNEFEYVHSRNGKFAMNFDVSDPSVSKMKMKNVILTNFKGTLINAVNCNIEAENCEFSNSQQALLNLTGGSYYFAHCTFANHYFSGQEAGWGISDNQTIALKDKYTIIEDDVEILTEYYPITKADFYNCIVWGARDKTTSRITINESQDDNISYYFENCLIAANATNDDPEDPNITPTIVNCIIGENPEFKKLLVNESGIADFIYDFRLTKESPARNVANRIISQEIPFDMNNINRFLDEGPDIGAYEWIEDPEENTN